MTEWPMWTRGTLSSTGLSSILEFLGVTITHPKSVNTPISINRPMASKIGVNEIFTPGYDYKQGLKGLDKVTRVGHIIKIS